jgi:hypothetical protein
MMWRKILTVVAATGTLVAVLVACGSTKQRSVSWPDPEALITTAQATLTEPADVSFDGTFHVASGEYPNGQTIMIKTFRSQTDRQADLDAGGNASATIVSKGGQPVWVAYVYPSYADTPLQPSAYAIAGWLDGEVR